MSTISLRNGLLNFYDLPITDVTYYIPSLDTYPKPPEGANKGVRINGVFYRTTVKVKNSVKLEKALRISLQEYSK